MRQETHLQGGAKLITDIETREGKVFTSTYVLDSSGSKGQILCSCTGPNGSTLSAMCEDNSVQSCDCGDSGDCNNLVCCPVQA